MGNGSTRSERSASTVSWAWLTYGSRLHKNYGVMNESHMVKVAFPLDAEHSGGIERERLWATPQADGTYRIENSPFHAYEISYCDCVYANLQSGDLVFAKIARRGGHSTYRLRLPRHKEHGYFLEIWPQLASLGCTYESTADERRIYSIDLPPSVDVRKVYDVLTGLEQVGIVEFEEGHYCGPSANH